MYSATAKSEQLLTRSGSESTKGSRRGFDLLDHGAPVTSVLTIERRRASLVLQLKAIETRMAALRGGKERDALIAQKMNLQAQISEIRSKLKGPKTTPDHFVEICRERMTKAEFKILMHEASIRARAAEQVAAELLAKNP